MSKKPLEVIAGTPDHPLVIGEIEIPCYVLEDETRVLVQNAMISALGMARGTARGDGSDRLANFTATKSISPFVPKTLTDVSKPVRFRMPQGGIAHGYSALLLAELCETVLAAREAGNLHHQQRHIADRCEVLMRGFARVGIIALVDEATGYQEVRTRRALATILEQFITEELQPWTKTFPYEFYEQIFRLKRWGKPDGVKRPSIIGHYTNDIVYARLAPGVLEELKARNPVLPSGNRKDKHHQWFTPDLGHPKLKEHLAAVIALMRAAANWSQFQRSLKRAFPVVNDQYEMNLGDD